MTGRRINPDSFRWRRGFEGPRLTRLASRVDDAVLRVH